MFKLKECGNERGDCTAPYDVIMDRPYTVREFIGEILQRKRRGKIKLCIGSWDFLDAFTLCKYNDDKILYPCPDEYLDREISSAKADGGWGIMDYYIKLKENSQNVTDIVKFVEEISGWRLTDYQKEFIQKVYEAEKDNKQLIYIPPRGSNNRYEWRMLYALVVVAVAKERGLIKGEALEKVDTSRG